MGDLDYPAGDISAKAREIMALIRHQVFVPDVTTMGHCPRCGAPSRGAGVCADCRGRELDELLPEQHALRSNVIGRMYVRACKRQRNAEREVLDAAGRIPVADTHEIAAMAQNVVTDDATLSLLVRLRSQGGVGNEAADLIEWFIDQRSAGDEYVIRADKEHPVGAIYTGVEMVGEIVRLVPTGRRIQG